MSLHHTPFHEIATQSGAQLHEWQGWMLARSYGDVASEYGASVNGAAIHDSSYAGRIRATGEDTLDLLHRLSTNAVVSLQPGRGAPTVLTTDRGRILDLIIVVNLEDHVLLLTSPQTREAVVEWIDKYTIVEDVELGDVTVETAMLSIIGPGAWTVLRQTLCLPDLEPYEAVPFQSGASRGHVIRRDMVGHPRFDVVTNAADGPALWRVLTDAGAVPMGQDALEVLKVERGEPWHGTEMGDAYNPLETGLWGSISFTKGCYIGQEVIARLDTYQKVQRHLVSLDLSPDAAVEQGSKLTRDGKQVGHVTSVARVPTTGRMVSMAYVRKEAAAIGTRLAVDGNDGAWAEVQAQALPFGPGEGE